MNTPERSVAEKVLQLTIERNETKDRKKAAMGGYNDEIKRIEAEINELIADSKDDSADDE